MAEPHVGICGCRSCQPEASLLWALDAALPLVSQKAALIEDPFQLEEMAMAATLSASFDSASSDVRALLLASLSPPVDLRLLEAALDDAARLLKIVVTALVLEDIRATIFRVMGFGYADAQLSVPPNERLRNRPPSDVRPLLDSSPMAARVAEHTIESVRHYADSYLGQVLFPSIRARLAEVIDATDPTQPPSPTALGNAITRAFTQRGYWRMLANAATSRAYHYGLLKTAMMHGKRGYRWHTVVDSRTSEVCLTMNGLEFWVADAVNALERIAATDDPQAATKLMPWRTPEEVSGQTAANLRDAGLLVPPAHPHCRSTLVVL